MRALYRAGAETLFILHALLLVLVLFGWAVPALWWPYMGTMVATLLSDVVFGYCILSKWEFDLRKKLDPSIDYRYAWATYYTYKLTNYRISDTFFHRAAILALLLWLGANLYLAWLL